MGFQITVARTRKHTKLGVFFMISGVRCHEFALTKPIIQPGHLEGETKMSCAS